MNAVVDPFIPPVHSVQVRPIENGYILTVYSQGRAVEWYCISPEEVAEKMSRYI